jgi:SpoVK/Ycf46/Vps4 family AAA+-type ATPase
MNKWFGESNKLIAATFNLARKLAPSVVFIDEIDAFLSQRDGTEGSAMSSMKSEFLTLWDGLLSERGQGGEVVGDKMMTNEDEDDGVRHHHRRRGFSLFGRHEGDIATEDDYSAPIEENNNSPLLPTPAVIVLGATNRPYDVDPAILRRLPRSFEIPLPPLQSRLQLLRLFLAKQTMTKEAKEYLPELAKQTEGYSGSDLKEVCRAAAWEPVREMTTGASRRAVGVTGDVMISSTNGGSRDSKPLLKRSSSGFPPRGAKARPVNINDFTLALHKVKRTGESARQFHAKEFVRGREDRAMMAADISRATTSNGATVKNGVPINEMANIDIHQLMAMAMAAASSMKHGNKNTDGSSPISFNQSEDDEDNPPEMSKAAG